MIDKGASRTAIGAALARAMHLLHYGPRALVHDSLARKDAPVRALDM
ncbi:MAG TPA: hypothetical protein VMD09_15725 [Solirubrobacteraceae bacterium]|nr:hypothetical protein [Solirubrobacteraceae bacterium]